MVHVEPTVRASRQLLLESPFATLDRNRSTSLLSLLLVLSQSLGVHLFNSIVEGNLQGCHRC